MNNIVKFRLDAYTLSQIAEAWKCDEQTVIQLAIDGLLRLSVRTQHGKLVEFDDEGEPIDSLSPFPLSFGRYLFLDVEDLVEIDKHGQADVSIFYNEDRETLVFEKPLSCTKSHLRLVKIERERFEKGIASHQMVNIEVYQALQSERDALKIKAENLEAEGNAMKAEIEALKATIPKEETEKLTPENSYISNDFKVLNQATFEFWSTADPDDKTTHPTNKQVATWLEEQGFSNISAKQGAVIIRPEWAANGRRQKMDIPI